MDGLDTSVAAPVESAPQATDISSILAEQSNLPDLSTPEPTPPVAEAPQPVAPVEAAPAAPVAEEFDDEWFEKLLAESEKPADPFARFLDDTQFQQATATPEALQAYATEAREFLKQQAESFKGVSELQQGAEYIGGQKNVPFALNLVGDLLRGELPVEEEGAAPGTTYLSRALSTLHSRQQGEGGIYDQTVAAILNHPASAPILELNKDFFLQKLGLNPQLLADYQQVTQLGGFQMPEAVNDMTEFFKEKNIDPALQQVFKSLDPDVQKDMMQRTEGVVKSELQVHKRLYDIEQGNRVAAQQAEYKQRVEAEWKSTETLATQTRGIYQEYIQKGEALGLDPLQARGVAALAYEAMEDGYWKGGDARRVTEAFLGHIKTGNELQINSGRSQYQKIFEQSWRNALKSAPLKRPSSPKPTVPGARAPIAPPSQQPAAQFNPAAPPSDRVATGLNEIMREFGMIG